jgi:hypothetical protein
MVVLNDAKVDKQKVVDVPSHLVDDNDLEQLDDTDSTNDTSLAS